MHLMWHECIWKETLADGMQLHPRLARMDVECAYVAINIGHRHAVSTKACMCAHIEINVGQYYATLANIESII